MQFLARDTRFAKFVISPLNDALPNDAKALGNSDDFHLRRRRVYHHPDRDFARRRTLSQFERLFTAHDLRRPFWLDRQE